MCLINSNNEIIGACLFQRLSYSLSNDRLEGRKHIRERIIVNLFSGGISECIYFPVPWVSNEENVKRLARTVVCNDEFPSGSIYTGQIT